MKVGSEAYIDKLLKWEHMAFMQRAPWEDLWDRVYEIVAPERFLLRNGKTPETIHDRIWDSTAVLARKKLNSNLIAGLVPSWAPWFYLTPGPMQTGEDRKKLIEALEPINKVIHLYINTSNLITEIGPAFDDAIIGTGGITVQPPEDGVGLEFKNLSVENLAIDKDSRNRVRVSFRKHDLKAWVILENKKWVDAIRAHPQGKDFESQLHEKPDTEVEICEANTPAENGGINHDIILKKLKILLEHKEFKSPAHIIFRWNEVDRFPWGIGPAIDTFPDIRTVNRYTELFLEAQLLAMYPPVTARDDGIVNPNAISFGPRDVIPVMTNDRQNPTLSRLDTGGNFQAGIISRDDLRLSIENNFYVNRFSGPGTPQTATEILEKAKVIALELGPTYSRFEYELLTPMVKRIVSLLIDQNVIPPAARINDNDIKVVYTSNLAQAQRMNEVEQLMGFLQMTQAFLPIDPRAGAKIDTSKALDEIAERMNITQDILRSSEEIDQLSQEALETMQQADAAGVGSE